MSLCWIANDFCAVTEFNQYYTDINLQDWMQCLALNSLALSLTLQDDDAMANVMTDVNEARFFLDTSAIEREDDDWFVLDDVEEDLAGRICFAAIRHQRRIVVDTLLKGFGSCEDMFASLYAAKHNTFEEKWRRKEEIWSLVDELQDGVDGTEDAAVKQRLEQQIDKESHGLSDDQLNLFVTERLKSFALCGPVGIGDDNSKERMAGYLWCSEGCPAYILVDFST
jgi:hypothetical protein